MAKCTLIFVAWCNAMLYTYKNKIVWNHHFIISSCAEKLYNKIRFFILLGFEYFKMYVVTNMMGS